MASTDQHSSNTNNIIISLHEALIYDDNAEHNIIHRTVVASVEDNNNQECSSNRRYLTGPEWNTFYLGLASGLWIQTVTFAIVYYTIIVDGDLEATGSLYQLYVEAAFYILICVCCGIITTKLQWNLYFKRRIRLFGWIGFWFVHPVGLGRLLLLHSPISSF